MGKQAPFQQCQIKAKFSNSQIIVSRYFTRQAVKNEISGLMALSLICQL